jgi:hypothetical protein
MTANSTEWTSHDGRLVAHHEDTSVVLTWFGRSGKPGVDMVRFDSGSKLLRVFPTLAILGNRHPQFDQVRELQLDTEAYREDFQVEIEEGEYGLELLDMPDGFGRVFVFGLGLLRQYRGIINAIESATDCDVVHFGAADYEGAKANIFHLDLNRFARYKHAVDLNFQRARVVVSRLNKVEASNTIADLLGKTHETPILGRHPTIQAITRALTDHAPLDADERSALVGRMSMESKKVARENPPALGKLRQGIELVTLEVLIDQFADGLRGRNAGDETWWQQFFTTNTFALQQLFAAPVALYGDQLLLRMPNMHGSGGRIADFVLVNTLTSSAVVVEIKTPAARLIGSRYRGAKGAEVHLPHTDLSGAVAQLQAQMESAVTDFPKLVGQTQDAPPIETSTVRGAVIVGRLESLDDERRQSLMRFRAGLHGIEVLTFDEVHDRLRGLHAMLSDQPAPTAS